MGKYLSEIAKNHREAIIMQRSDMIAAFQYRQKNDRNIFVNKGRNGSGVRRFTEKLKAA